MLKYQVYSLRHSLVGLWLTSSHFWSRWARSANISTPFARRF